MADLSLLEDDDYTDNHHDILLTIPTLNNLEDDEFDPDHDLGFISAHDFFSRRNLDRNPHPISSIHRNPLPIDRQNQVNFVIDMFHQRVEQSQFNSVLIQDNDNRNHNHNHNNRLIRSSNVDFGVGDDDNDVNWNEFDVGFDSGLGFLDFDCENPNCENRVCDHDDGDGVNGGSVYGFAEDDDDDDDNWGARVAPGSPEIVFGGLGVHLRVEDDSAVDDEASLHLCWDSLHLEDDDDDDNVVSNMHLSQIQRRIQETEALDQDVGFNRDTTSLDDQAFTTEAALDRCILRLIASCCNGDKLVRAIELVKLLSLEKSVRGAIKLVTAMKLLNLAERFNTIFEERLLKEAAETMLKETTEPKSTTGTDTSKVFTSPEVCNAPEPVNEFPSVQLPSPSFVIKKTVEEPATVQLSSLLFMKKKNVEKPATVQLSSPLFVKKKTKEEAPKVVKVSHTKEITKPENKTPAKKIVGELKAGNNPFAKSSINNQEKTSLFDSLNKLKNNESSTTR